VAVVVVSQTPGTGPQFSVAYDDFEWRFGGITVAMVILTPPLATVGASVSGFVVETFNTVDVPDVAELAEVTDGVRAG
jgi:hypothetical protein